MKKNLLTLLSIVVLAAGSTFALPGAPGQPDNDPSVAYTKTNHQVSIYPNPVTDNVLQIRSDDAFVSIEIINVVGQKIQTINNVNQASEVTLELGLYERGLYIVRVTFDDKRTVIKKILIKD